MKKGVKVKFYFDPSQIYYVLVLITMKGDKQMFIRGYTYRNMFKYRSCFDTGEYRFPLQFLALRNLRS